MKTISKQRIEKYKYDSENERKQHVEKMKLKGWQCSDRVKQSDHFGGEYYWYGEFYKYE